jgi:hypothetical protein
MQEAFNIMKSRRLRAHRFQRTHSSLAFAEDRVGHKETANAK